MKNFTRKLSKLLSYTLTKHGNEINNYSSKTQQIRNSLIALTQDHCSYCDCLLRQAEYTPHIDHFKPKSKYPELEKIWENLYITCPKCNEIKSDEFQEIEPLKPDEKGYRFQSFFRVEISSGKILPKGSAENKRRAQATIDWLDLNSAIRCEARVNEFEKYKESSDKRINFYSYRFYLKLASKLDE